MGKSASRLAANRSSTLLSNVVSDTGESHFYIPIQLKGQGRVVNYECMVDSGASTIFISDRVVRELELRTEKFFRSIPLSNIDGSLNRAGDLTDFIELELRIGDHTHDQIFAVTDIGEDDVIIGIDWLREHNPNIDWAQGSLRLDRCPSRCQRHTPSTSTTEKVPPPKPLIKAQRLTEVEETDQADQWYSEFILNESERHHGIRLASTKSTISQRLAEQAADTQERPIEDMVPEQYHNFLPVFSKAASERLPERKPWDHAIDLIPDAPLPKPAKVYPMTPPELKELDEFIDENLRKGYIRQSKSPMAAPVFFVKKKDGKLRLVQDYRALNNITVKNRYPIPLISEVIDSMKGAKHFTELDLRWGFNNVRIKEGDEWKAAFRTNRGLFEPTVMFFGQTNAPGTFQTMVNEILSDLIASRVVIVYLDNIWIFTKDMTEHRRVVSEVLHRLQANDLFCKPEKCRFEVDKVEVLGTIVSENKVEMDTVKLAGVAEWPVPRNVTEVQSFTGFANFYRRFIRDFSEIARPLNDLTKKGFVWRWAAPQQEAFDTLKRKFCEQPILQMADPEQPFLLETDASNFAVGAVLSQRDVEGSWKPVAYYSKSFSEAERNYEIHDKELAAIVKSLDEYRHYLEGGPHPIRIITDHKNLEYFATAKDLTRRQARWALFLSRFNYTLEHRPGKLSGKPDALSRRADHDKGEDDNKGRILLKPEVFRAKAAKRGHSRIAADRPLLTRIRTCAKRDDEVATALETLRDKAPVQLKRGLEEWNTEDGLILFRGKVYVPKDDDLRRDLVHAHHDAPAVGHPGRWKTYELLSRNYWWPGMSTYVEKYVDGCEVCTRNKNLPQKPLGLLQPNEVPQRPWGITTIDFITKLPESTERKFTALMVVVDRLTKRAHFIPTFNECDAEQCAKLYMQRVWRHHGAPDQVISDRGSQFDSDFMKEFLRSIGSKTTMSTAYHPQTDGQTERVNQEVETYVRIFCDYNQANWADLIAHAEFAYNNRAHASTKQSPFYLNYGTHPVFDVTILPSYKSATCEERVHEIKRVQEEARSALEVAAERMKRHYDAKRQATPELQVGDRVYLDAKNLPTTQPARKFAAKRHGPFEIVEKVSPLNYRVALPEHWKKVHDVFHVSLLRKAAEDAIPGRVQPPVPAPPVAQPTFHEELYAIDEILDSRFKRGKLEYLIHWKGYDAQKDHTWQAAETLDTSDPIIDDFHRKNPSAPRRLAATLFANIPFRPLENDTELDDYTRKRLTKARKLFDWTNGRYFLIRPPE